MEYQSKQVKIQAISENDTSASGKDNTSTQESKPKLPDVD